MKTRKLGRTDIEITPICFGCWAIVGGFNWGEQDEKDSIAALQAAFDSGITFFDTAEGYGSGRSEQMIAKALGTHRDEMVIASKVSPTHFEHDDLVEACNRSLTNLGTDWIDLYQLHWPNDEIPVHETLGVLEQLKQQGKIRAYGVSNFGPGDFTTGCLDDYEITTNQVAYNLLFRAIEFNIQPMCVEHGMSILCYSPIMQGLLAGKFTSADDVPEDRARTRHFSGSRPQARHGQSGAEQLTFEAIEGIRGIAQELGKPMVHVALAWLLAQEAVGAVIVGGRNPDQARENAGAGQLELTGDVIRRLGEITEPLKQALGDNPDMWQEVSRINYHDPSRV